MGANTKTLLEKFEDDFNKISSKDAWTREDIIFMKDLQKLMYYIEARCAMKDGEEYPGSEYIEDERNSYRRGRSATTGRYVSRDSGRGGNGNNSYDLYSGRRYYDDEKEHAIHRMKAMMESEENPEVRMAIKRTIAELEGH